MLRHIRLHIQYGQHLRWHQRIDALGEQCLGNDHRQRGRRRGNFDGGSVDLADAGGESVKRNRSSSARWMFPLITVYCLLVTSSPAVTRYVSLTGGNVPPFTNWAMAATNIQVAIDY